MAALVKHVVLSKSNHNIVQSPIVSGYLVQQRFYRAQNKAKQNKVKPKKFEKVPVPETRKLKSVGDSIASRGFLRCYKDYTPPADVSEKLQTLYSTVIGSSPSGYGDVIPQNLKFDLLNSCFQEFNHSVPNSILHRVNTYGDLEEFYMTPIDSTLPLDKLTSADLPPNLHIQLDPIRFHPDDDKLFKGVTAFPKSSTLVTGLRSKRKYKGHLQTEAWPIE